MVTQEDVELAYQEAMMNMARLNRTGMGRKPSAWGLQTLWERPGNTVTWYSWLRPVLVHSGLFSLKSSVIQNKEIEARGRAWLVTDYTPPLGVCSGSVGYCWES